MGENSDEEDQEQEDQEPSALEDHSRGAEGNFSSIERVIWTCYCGVVGFFRHFSSIFWDKVTRGHVVAFTFLMRSCAGNLMPPHVLLFTRAMVEQATSLHELIRANQIAQKSSTDVHTAFCRGRINAEKAWKVHTNRPEIQGRHHDEIEKHANAPRCGSPVLLLFVSMQRPHHVFFPSRGRASCLTKLF